MKTKTVNLNDFIGHKHPASKLYRSIELKVIHNLVKDIVFKHPSLDLGCGDGYLSSILFNDKFTYGLDNNEAGDVAIAKKKKRYKEILIESAEKMTVESNFLNFVFSNSVLEHIPPLNDVLKEVNRALRPNGYLLISMPSNKFYDYLSLSELLKNNLFSIFNNLYRKYRNKKLNHYHLYSLAQWRKILYKHGFKIEKYAYGIDRKTLLYWDKLAIKTKLMGMFNNMAEDKVYAENFEKINNIIKSSGKEKIGANITILARKK